MNRVRVNAYRHHRADRAYLLFDVFGEQTEMVAVWDFMHPTIVAHAPDTLLDPFQLQGVSRLHYDFEVGGFARGLYVARPTWMHDEPAINPPPPRELEQ